ncbi:YdgA family protein [Shimwellia pseudoproteus]|uniref:YdgA family protein n=1 Tax=Shimwellia pseudoproteus TaxID=570012 RepID=UPI0018EB01F3|nr:YdgA family protein [Shimwellia pseudoproteus]MBJ3816916.1 YdgA family protein [Shimwellia pseudoproteus]
MKKSLVAVGVIVALGVIWTGASWYTGKQLEGRMADMIATANRQLQQTAPDAGLALSYTHYQRGVFTSQMQLVIGPDSKATGWLKAGQQVVLDETLSHGPFPLAQLKHLSLIPSMASVRTTLVNNDTTRHLFEMTKDKSFIDAQTRISYSGATASDIQLLPLDYQKDQDKISFSGANISADVDNDGNGVAITGKADSAVIATLNDYGQHVQLTINGLNTDGNSKLADFGERTGTQKLTITKAAIAIEGKEMAVLEGFNLNGQSAVAKDGKHLDASFDYALDALKVQNQNMGSGKLALKFANVDGEALHAFSQKYNTETRALLDSTDNQEEYTASVLDIFFANLPLLLKGEPVVTIAPLSWKNDKGESTLNLSVLMKDPQASGQATSDDQLIGNSIKSVDGKLVIPMDMATALMTQVAKLEGYQESDAEKLADQQVKGVAAMGQMFRLTTTDNNNITSSLQYSDGQVTLNGQKMSLVDFLGMFGIAAPEPGAVPPPAPVQP